MLPISDIKTMLPSANIKTISLERPSGIFRTFFDKDEGLIDVHSSRPADIPGWIDAIAAGTAGNTNITDVVKTITQSNAAAARTQLMRVNVKASIITSANNYLPEDLSLTSGNFLAQKSINFNDHLYVVVIQSLDSRLSKIIQAVGSDILKYLGPLNDWNGTSDFDDFIRCNIFGALTIDRFLDDAVEMNNDGEFNVLDMVQKSNQEQMAIPWFKQAFMNVQTRKLFEEGDLAPRFDKRDANGKKVATITKNIEFMLDNSTPSHLSYFTFTYLDMKSLLETLQSSYPSGQHMDKVQDEVQYLMETGRGAHNHVDLLGLDEADFTKIGALNTPVNFDAVFEKGVISGESYFFKNPVGDIWTGPVHKMPNDNRFMTGNTHGSGPNTYLELVKTKNVKVQDWRNRNGIMSAPIMNDFQNEQATLRSIVRGFSPQLRALNPATNNVHSYVSDAFLTGGARKTAKFMFLVDFNALMSKNSLFGRAIKTQGTSLRQTIFNLSRIKSLKIYRDRVRKGVGTNALGDPVERYEVDESTDAVLVAQTSQKAGALAVDSTASIIEEQNMSFDNGSIRAFNVVDRNFHSSARSQYQYRVEIEVDDRTLVYFRRLINKLHNFVSLLQNYLSDIENSTLRYQEIDVYGHITSHSPLSTPPAQRREGYDPRTDGLTGEFSTLMRQKYYTGTTSAGGVSNNLQIGIGDFITTLKIFLQNGAFDAQVAEKVSNFISLILNPATTSPESISAVLQMVQEAIDKMEGFVGTGSQATNIRLGKSNGIISSNAMEKGVIYIDKTFASIYDLSEHDGYGYDYLSTRSGQTVAQSWGQIGLRSLSGAEWRDRVHRETLKFFTSARPDLTKGLTAAGRSYAGVDSIDNSLHSYLSPSMLKMETVVDLLNGNAVSSGKAMAMVESKIALSGRYASISRHEAQRNMSFYKKVRKVYDEPDAAHTKASSETVAYLAQTENMVATPSHKPLTLADRQLGKGSAITTQQRYSSAAFKKATNEMNNAKAIPNAFYQAIMQRELTKGGDMFGGVLTAGNLKTASPMEPDDASPFEPFGMDSKSVKNIAVLDLTTRNNLVEEVPQKALQQFPNQIKALLTSLNSGNSIDVRQQLQGTVRKNIFKDSSQAASTRFKYNLLVEVQYLSNFQNQKGDSEKAKLMHAPTWKKLNATAFSENVGRKMLCRLVKRDLPQWKIFRPKSLDLEIYDDYFLLVPDSLVAGTNKPNPLTNPRLNLFDTQLETIQANSWTPLEVQFSAWTEFGIANLPEANINYAECQLNTITQQLASFTDLLGWSPPAAAFRTEKYGCTPITEPGPQCDEDNPCAPGQHCVDGVCVDIPIVDSECSDDADCEAGYRCDGEGNCVLIEWGDNGQEEQEYQSNLHYSANLPGMQAALNVCTSLQQALENQLKDLSVYQDQTSQGLAAEVATLDNATTQEQREISLATISGYNATMTALAAQASEISAQIEEQNLCKAENLAAIQAEMQNIQARVVQDMIASRTAAGDIIRDLEGNVVECDFPEQLGSGLETSLQTLDVTEVFVSSWGTAFMSPMQAELAGGAAALQYALRPNGEGAGTGTMKIEDLFGNTGVGNQGSTQQIQDAYNAQIAAISSTGQIDDLDMKAFKQFGEYLANTEDWEVYYALLDSIVNQYPAIGPGLRSSLFGFSSEIFELALDLCGGDADAYSKSQTARLGEALQMQGALVNKTQNEFACPFLLYYLNASQSGQSGPGEALQQL